jgi:hypothetical protein
MAKHVLSMVEEYQDTEWGLWEVWRECVSNAKDAIGHGATAMELDWANSVAYIRTKGEAIPLDALLMGTTTSRPREDAIGTFGEGLPMACLAAARLIKAGQLKRFCIYNVNEVWTPSLEYSEQWKREVLVIRTRKLRKLRAGTEIQIDGVSTEMYAHLLSRCLFTDPEFDPEQAVLVDGSSSVEILRDERYKGHIFSKGVYITQREDLQFGYNLLRSRLNRDRSMMNEWNLKWDLQNIAARVIAKDIGGLGGEMAALIEKGGSLEGSDCGAFKYHDDAIDVITDRFDEKYGKQAIPVSNMQESRQAEVVGLTPVLVNPLVRDLVETRKGGFYSRVKEASKKPKKRYLWSDLTPAEKETLSAVVKQLAKTFEAGEEEALWACLHVADFGSSEVKGRYLAKDQIEIARSVLSSYRETLNTVSHELAHRYGGDGSVAHHEAQVRMLLDIICLPA